MSIILIYFQCGQISSFSFIKLCWENIVRTNSELDKYRLVCLFKCLHHFTLNNPFIIKLIFLIESGLTTLLNNQIHFFYSIEHNLMSQKQLNLLEFHYLLNQIKCNESAFKQKFCIPLWCIKPLMQPTYD